MVLGALSQNNLHDKYERSDTKNKVYTRKFTDVALMSTPLHLRPEGIFDKTKFTVVVHIYLL